MRMYTLIYTLSSLHALNMINYFSLLYVLVTDYAKRGLMEFYFYLFAKHKHTNDFSMFKLFIPIINAYYYNNR